MVWEEQRIILNSQVEKVDAFEIPRPLVAREAALVTQDRGNAAFPGRHHMEESYVIEWIRNIQ